jgi:type II secretory pathway pseudopilin PulG
MRFITQRAAVSLPGRKDSRRRSRRGSAGISLLEVLMAISLLGISFATIFSGLSAALRATDHLGAFDRGNAFATQKLSELNLDPTLQAGEVRTGMSPDGTIWWQARTQLMGARPGLDPKKPVQLVRLVLDVAWQTRAGRQILSLESLKLCVPEPAASPGQ